MKRIAVACLLLAAINPDSTAYQVYFKEQYYKLYHIHYIQYPDDTIENIYWLEQARKADFCNPLYALAKIVDQKHWERYRYLFNMHIDLKMIEQHLYLGSKYDKQVAYFFNAPWKDENLKSLEIAESAYRAALAYWTSAQEWARKAQAMRWIYLPEIQFWDDESFRIMSGELDYRRIINRELTRLRLVREQFAAMDGSTY
jgi:hypothetical protein